MEIIFANEFGCMKRAKGKNINFENDHKIAIITPNNQKYSFRFFINEKNNCIFTTISKDCVSFLKQDDFIKLLLLSKEKYEDITSEWIKEQLIKYNASSSIEEQRNIKRILYFECSIRNHIWDDDLLADALSYAEYGQLFKYCSDIDELANEIAKTVNEYEKYF